MNSCSLAKPLTSCDVLEVGAVGLLVMVAEAHQHLARPGIVVVRGDVDDARLERRVGRVDRRSDLLELSEQRVRRDDVGIEAHEVRRIGRADLDHALDAAARELLADGERLEVGAEAHRLVDLAEDELVAAVGVARLRERRLDDAGHPADSTRF